MPSPQANKGTASSAGPTRPPTGVSDQLYAAYLEHRRYLIDGEREAAKSYDRWLLTLSGGALGLSMAFAKDIAPPAGAEGPGWLLAAWLFLVGAIAVGLVCIYVSQTAHEEFRGHLDKTLEEFAAKSQDAGFWTEVRKKQARSCRARLVGGLNIASGAAFVTGIVLLSVFACKNIPSGSSETMNKKPTESVQKSVHKHLPVEPSAPLPGDLETIPCSEPGRSETAALKPAPGPVDQAPPQNPEKPTEKK